jgi:hypothetical protein
VTKINITYLNLLYGKVTPGAEQCFEQEEDRFYVFNTLKSPAILFPTKRKNSFDVANLNSYIIIHKPRA